MKTARRAIAILVVATTVETCLECPFAQTIPKKTIAQRKLRRGGKKRRKTSRRTPLPKMGFGPPFAWYIFHTPPRCRCSVWLGQEVKTLATRSSFLFWRGPKNFLEDALLVRSPPPTRFAPAHIMAPNCTPNSRKNAMVFRPLRTVASHELLYELLRLKTTTATPLAESSPSPNSQLIRVGFWQNGFLADFYF